MNTDSPSSTVVSMVAICGFGLLVSLTSPLWSGFVSPLLDPSRVKLPARTEPLANLGMLGQPDPDISPVADWSDAEIRAALIKCIQSVAPVVADVVPIAPIRNGDCGTPAPVLLRSIGDKNKVTFDPPLLFNCPMVVALYRWLDEAVQPAARETLGSPVSRIVGSSYACRTVYSLPTQHLSQHAFANALDLPLFVLADGRKIDFTRDWGPTRRDLIAAKMKPASSGAFKSVAGQQRTRLDSEIAVTDVVKVSAHQAPEKDAKDAELIPDPAVDAKATFLRLVQLSACKTFSTVLGPEANDVHRTHLHLDLQDRESLNVCK
jgi:hypothetical protein